MTMTDTTRWTVVCALDQVVPERGVAALVAGHQVAVFLVDDGGGTKVYAIDNFEPIAGANVLARGIVGTADEVLYVASPLNYERFALATGECLTTSGVSVWTWPTRLVDDVITVGS